MEQQALTRGVMGAGERAANQGLIEQLDGAHVVAASYDAAKDAVVLDVVFIQHATIELTGQTLTAPDWEERIVEGGRESGRTMAEHIAGRLHPTPRQGELEA